MNVLPISTSSGANGLNALIMKSLTSMHLRRVGPKSRILIIWRYSQRCAALLYWFCRQREAPAQGGFNDTQLKFIIKFIIKKISSIVNGITEAMLNLLVLLTLI